MRHDRLVLCDDTRGVCNPTLVVDESPASPTFPASSASRTALRINTLSEQIPDDNNIVAGSNNSLHPISSPPPFRSSELESLQPYSSRLAPRHPALRRTALLVRASRSAASLGHQVPTPLPVEISWPAPPPSRTQSLNLQPMPSPPLAPPVVSSRTMSYSSDSGGAPIGESNMDGSLTSAGLSWRRLHISRAKLKATATTSELLSGFAMVAMVELQINENTNVPEWLFVLFSVCTTVLVAVHIFALMISTYILPSIDAVSRLCNTSNSNGEAAELAIVSESPHDRMRWFIELAWAFSTVLGLFLFLVEVAILCWVKFWDYSFTAAIASTAIVVPSLAMFIGFAVHFYHNLVVQKCETSDMDLRQLEMLKQQLDTAKLT